MKCVAIKGQKEFEIKEMERPITDLDDVVIKVKKAGICGSDIHYWDIGSPVGLVMGHEFSGEVIDNGSRSDLKIGDRVTALPISPCGKCEACLSGNVQYCSETWSDAVGLSLTSPGAYAPITKVRPDMVIKLPDNVGDTEGTLVEPSAVSLHAVHLADVKLGDKVLVIGGGIIGLMAAYIAKLEGAIEVILTETNEKRGEKAVNLGVADKWYDAKNPEHVKDLLDVTNGGFDKVIECCGNSQCVTDALTLVKPGGKVILVGVSLNAITIPSTLIVLKELSVVGAIAYTKEEFKQCIDLIARKKLEVMKFVSDEVSLEGVQKSFERLTSGNDDAVKIVIDPNK